MPALTKVDISFSLPVPTILVRIAVRVVLLYRRVRYGYAFRRIKLTKGKFAIVDPEDFEQLNQYNWYCTYYGYAARKIPKKDRKGKETRVLMHRELCPVPDELVVDHINRNPGDNRKANLRPATKQQNCWNAKIKKKRAETQYTGIHFDKRRGKWYVHITLDGRSTTCGYYSDEVEAAKAYDRLVKQHRGEFGVLNFPEQ
ncbi:MAG TPA: HNH endonuclease [Sedimentisphaerales bacterium]|nr:HNH endonuclease [Sedimentisphaerales bacterium]